MAATEPPPARRTGSADLGLLVLRIWFGLSLLALHGWSKIADFATMSGGFPDPLGLGSSATLAIAVGVEVLGSVLVIIGLFCRWAALAILIQLLIAFFVVHGGALSGPQSGETAWLYAGAALALVAAGSGRLSLDQRIARRRSERR